jgi:hypothetical protein
MLVAKYSTLEVSRDVREAVDPVEREQEHLAPVTQDDLQVWVTVNGASQDEPKCGGARLDVPSPAEGGEREVSGRVKPAVGRLTDRVRRNLGMDDAGRRKLAAVASRSS